MNIDYRGDLQVIRRETPFSARLLAYAFDGSTPIYAYYVGTKEAVALITEAFSDGKNVEFRPPYSKNSILRPEKGDMSVVAKAPIHGYNQVSVIVANLAMGHKPTETSSIYVIADDYIGAVSRASVWMPTPLFPEWISGLADVGRKAGLVSRLSESRGLSVFKINIDPEPWGKIVVAGIEAGLLKPVSEIEFGGKEDAE
jgi:hypothetical protein